jgi:hypothetical protein
MADINVAEQADKKAEAKVEADHKVATEPHTIHGVRRMLGAPGMIPSIAAGAGLAAVLVGGGWVPVAVGSLIGWGVERYQVLGGPVGRLVRKIRGIA